MLTSSSSVSQAQTGGTIISVGSVVDVVLKETLASVVGEALSQFNHRDQVSGLGKLVANAAEGLDLVLGRLVALLGVGHDFGVLLDGHLGAGHVDGGLAADGAAALLEGGVQLGGGVFVVLRHVWDCGPVGWGEEGVPVDWIRARWSSESAAKGCATDGGNKERARVLKMGCGAD